MSFFAGLVGKKIPTEISSENSFAITLYQTGKKHASVVFTKTIDISSLKRWGTDLNREDSAGDNFVAFVLDDHRACLQDLKHQDLVCVGVDPMHP